MFMMSLVMLGLVLVSFISDSSEVVSYSHQHRKRNELSESAIPTAH